jgi:hypothetical protein
MKNSWYLYLIIFIALHNITYAQYIINPTRPSAADNAFITSRGYTELEIGGLIQEDFYSVPALVKFSPLKKLELGVAFSGLINHSTIGADSETDVGDIGLQMKTPFYTTESFGAALLGRIDFPSETDPMYTTYLATSLIY